MSNLKEIIMEALESYKQPTLILKENCEISENLKYHIDNKLSLTDNVFRVYSENYFNLVNEVRNLWKEGKIGLNEEDILMVESSLGEKVKVNGEIVYLDAPFILEYEIEEDIIEEAKHRGKNVKLNKPFRTSGGPKKFAVYVKSKSGGIKKVTFGDPKLKVKNANKKAAKSFRARHRCDQKKDRTTAGYWSCNVGRYAKQLGLSSSNSW
jgi:translation initiation factor IF-1